MNKKVYLRGKLGTCWYNFTEGLAYMLTYKRTPKDVLYKKHLRYGDERPQYVNTYCRKDLEEVKKPLVIYVHGGGFVSGITDMRNAYLQNFAKEGYATASISYTYAPKKTYAEQLQEICSAVDFVFDRAEQTHIDLQNVVLAGESAGVYYIFFLAALALEPTLADKLGIKFKHIADLKIKAMIAHCGCVNLKNLLDKNCPQSKFPDMKMMVCSLLGRPFADARAFLATKEGEVSYPHIVAGFPPTFFTTGDKDWLRFEGYDMMKEYAALGIPYAHFEGTGALGLHAWTIVTKLKGGRECFAKTMEFLKGLN